MPIPLIANLQWMVESEPKSDAEGQLAALTYFAPLISKWIDASRDDDPVIRKENAAEALRLYKSFADWEQIEPPEGALLPLKQVQRRLAGICH